tara:strand:+ start:3395 stop:3808 length:414 start_codon:yes stop_codon:yes gene_type:complete
MGRTTERIGRQGEFYTCGFLAGFSDTVTLVPHGSEADILFDYNNNIYKCQVKTKSKPKKGSINWKFDLRRGSHTKNRHYQEGQIDIYALYCKPHEKIYFIPFDSKMTCITISEQKMKEAKSEETLINSLDQLKAKDE